MTAQLIRGATETSDEAAEPTEPSARAVLGATLTFLVLVALCELLARGFNPQAGSSRRRASSRSPWGSRETNSYAIRSSPSLRLCWASHYRLPSAFHSRQRLSIRRSCEIQSTRSCWPSSRSPKSRSLPCSCSGSDSACCGRSLSCSWSVFFRSSSRPRPRFRRCLRRSWSLSARSPPARCRRSSR
jgi:hypothetical protein